MNLHFKKTSLIALCLVCTVGIFCVSVYFWVEKNRQQMCFYGHLSDAIAQNQDRKAYYAMVTDGESKNVSDDLINSERILLPVALLVDIQARKITKNDESIVCENFVHMDSVAEKESPPIYGNIANESITYALQEDLENTTTKIIDYGKKRDFNMVSEVAYDFLLHVENIERETQSSFCMTKHAIESIGYAALHAEQFPQDRYGKSGDVYQSVIDAQAMGLSTHVLSLDKNAQKIHRLNAGIVCNDVPHIPFKEKYQNSL